MCTYFSHHSLKVLLLLTCDRWHQWPFTCPSFFKKKLLIGFSERRRERERETDRQTDLLFHLFMHSLVGSYVPWPGIEPTALVFWDNALTTEIPSQGLHAILPAVGAPDCGDRTFQHEQ